MLMKQSTLNNQSYAPIHKHIFEKQPYSPPEIKELLIPEITNNSSGSGDGDAAQAHS